jgi:hypothetical protein
MALLSPVLVDVAEDRCEVLSVGEETNDINVVDPLEVEPTARKPSAPARPQTGDSAQLTDPQ